MNTVFISGAVKGVTLILFACLASTGYAASTGECSGGIFEVVASIAYIEKKPTAPQGKSAKVKLRVPSDTDPLPTGACLRGGESISLKDEENGHLARVDVFYNGQITTITSNSDTFMVPTGRSAYKAAAHEFLERAFPFLSSFSPPEIRSKPTATQRGETIRQESMAPAEFPLRAIDSLRRLPTQLLTLDDTFIAGWRGGTAPYLCHGLSASGEVVVKGAMTSSDSCAVPLSPRWPTRIVVRDSLDSQYGWNIDPVQWGEIPRPEWVTDPMIAVSSGDRAAWAIWLWQNAPDKWRLQALSMLQHSSKESWLAGYFLRRILDEAPLKSVGATHQ